MTILVIRDLDDLVADRLRQRAAARGRSLEEEARDTLASSVSIDRESYVRELHAFRAQVGRSKGPSAEDILQAQRGF